MGIYDDVMEQIGGTPPGAGAGTPPPAAPPAAGAVTPPQGTPPSDAAPPAAPPGAGQKGMYGYSDAFQKAYGKR
jgi:hypothetical protein